MRINKQSETQEHYDLEQPRQTVHEGVYLLAVNQPCVSNDNSGDVYRQVTVALQQVGHGEGREHNAQQQYGIQRTVRQVDAVDQPHGETPEGVADASTNEELHQEVASHYCQTEFAAARNNLYQDNRQHVGHGVVAAAFQLKHRAQVLLQVHPLRPEQAEHRR